GTAGLDTINFSLGQTCAVVVCTIVLTSALPVVSESLTIAGGSNQPTISGNNLYRVFDLGAVTVNLSNLRIASGKAANGADISMKGTTLALSNVNFAGNNATGRGGAIAMTGATLTATNA